MHVDHQRARGLALGQVTDALEIDYALVAGESVDVLEAGLARVVKVVLLRFDKGLEILGRQ